MGVPKAEAEAELRLGKERLHERHKHNPQDSRNNGKPASQTRIFLIPGIQDRMEAG